MKGFYRTFKEFIRLSEHALAVAVSSQNFTRFGIREPREPAVLVGKFYVRALRLAEIKDDDFVDLLARAAEGEALVRAEILVKLDRAARDTGFFFRFAKGRLQTSLFGLDLPFREIPVIVAVVEN